MPPLRTPGNASCWGWARHSATFKVATELDALYNESPGCLTVAVPPTVQPLDGTCIRPNPPGTITSENAYHDIVSEVYPTGASIGITQLCSNSKGVDFVRMTRAFGASDCTGLHSVAYARDGLAWECFGTCHGVTNLTKAQLQGIYGDCSITNWSQVGGTPGPIKVYAVQAGSGIKKNWNTYLGTSDEAACASGANHIIRQNLNGPILANGDQNDAIFYFSIGQHKTNIPAGGDGSSLRSVEGFDPNNETLIENGTYPIGFFLSNVYCATGGAAPCPRKTGGRVKNYVSEAGWICKAKPDGVGGFTGKHKNNPWTGNNYRVEIENVIRANGFAPLTYGPTGGSTPGNSYCREFDH
ncbi:MAG: substrate-binding domain-containing protein [Acidimicrobiia bacterium]